MSRGLLDYLDDLPCGSIDSSPEYAYLGHFRDMNFIEQGHNNLAMADQIAAGNIPDLKAAGRNTPADSEPGNIASMGSSGQSGARDVSKDTVSQGMAGGSSRRGSSSGGSMLGMSGMLSSMVNGDDDFSGDTV